MSDVAKAWNAELSAANAGFQLSLATVFTHQSPYVKWSVGGIRKRCELADVLIAFIDRTPSVRDGVALLVQGKLSSNGHVSPSTNSEKTQFELLSSRPIFDVDTSPAPSNVDLQGMTPDSALVYGLTDPTSSILRGHSSWPHCWLIANNLQALPGTSAIAATECLARTLVGMLVGLAGGWDFRLPPAGGDWQQLAHSPRDDWSMLINYLLEQTFKKPLPRARQTSAGRISRGQEDVVHLVTSLPWGQRMHCMAYELSASAELVRFAGDSATTDEWREVGSDDGVSLVGSDGGGGEAILPSDDEPPPDGPISAIVFELRPVNR